LFSSLIGKFGVLAKGGELFNGDTGFAKNGAQCPYAKGLVIGNRNTGERRFAAKDYYDCPVDAERQIQFESGFE
jgi:hypothetical protein